MKNHESRTSTNSVLKNVHTGSEDRRLRIFIGGILFLSLFLKIIKFVYGHLILGNINLYGYSDFLINYEGGFVRRGLMGEILFQLCKISPIPLKDFISCICCIAFIGVVIYFYRKFKKEQICWWLLFSPLFLNFTCFIVRKDYLLYAILIAIVSLLRTASADILRKTVACVLVLFSLFIHEAFIFWGGALYILILLTDKKHRVFNYICIALAIISVAVLCMYKGNYEIATAIESSWNSILPGSPVDKSGTSIYALGWDTLFAFRYHLECNISSAAGYGGFVLLPLLLMAAYWLFSNYMLYFSGGSAEDRSERRMDISLLYPVFCIALIPMLTVLSCDTGRVFQYATITTLCAFLILPRQRISAMFPMWYKRIIEKFNHWLDARFPATRASVIFMLMILAVSAWWFNLDSSWSESVIGSIIKNSFDIFRVAFRLSA